jgi:hypothetical protein
LPTLLTRPALPATRLARNARMLQKNYALLAKQEIFCLKENAFLLALKALSEMLEPVPDATPSAKLVPPLTPVRTVHLDIF